jgi:hypothetical protein
MASVRVQSKVEETNEAGWLAVPSPPSFVWAQPHLPPLARLRERGRGRGCPVRCGRGGRGALSDASFGVQELVPAFDSSSQSGNKLPHSIIERHPLPALSGHLLPPLTVHPHPRPLSRKRARGGKWGCAHTKLGDGRRRGALGSGFVEMQQRIKTVSLFVYFVRCCDIIERRFFFCFFLFNPT